MALGDRKRRFIPCLNPKAVHTHQHVIKFLSGAGLLCKMWREVIPKVTNSIEQYLRLIVSLPDRGRMMKEASCLNVAFVFFFYQRASS